MSKPRKYGTATEEAIKSALDDLAKGKSQREVSKIHGIHRSTLQNKLHNKHQLHPGRPTLLTSEEEEALVNHMIIVAKWGFPLDSLDIRMIVKNMLDKAGCAEHRFVNNLPGIQWYQAFMKRHRGRLVQRQSQNLAPKRAQLSVEGMNTYFTNLQETLKDIPPENILHYDETNLTDDPGRKKCIFYRGVKYPERVMHSSKSSTSLMFAVTASGELLPVCVVYKAENIWDSWTEGGPLGARYGRSKSGWFESRNFEDWFTTVAVPYFRRLNGPKVMIGDNLSSHFNKDVLAACERYDIRFVCLPPNATHLCQPLDVAFLDPSSTHGEIC